MGMTVGSWDKKVIHGEVGGPATLFGKQLGYYLYGETETPTATTTTPTPTRASTRSRST